MISLPNTPVQQECSHRAQEEACQRVDVGEHLDNRHFVYRVVVVPDLDDQQENHSDDHQVHESEHEHPLASVGLVDQSEDCHDVASEYQVEGEDVRAEVEAFAAYLEGHVVQRWVEQDRCSDSSLHELRHMCLPR